MHHIMAIDQGTSSSRAIIFDLDGRIVGMGQRPFDMVFPADGWVEQEPEVLWQTTLGAGREAIANAGLSASDIDVMGITNQRETTLVWDRQTGECLYNAIVWQDRRTAGQCENMRADGMQQSVARITGLVVDPYFSGTKLAWLLGNISGLRERAESGELCFGTVDSFLIWRLTRGARHVTDASNAARTMLFDIGSQSWSDELLTYLDVPVTLLPEVLDCAADFGVADARWFGAPIPILGVAGDQQAALIGQGCLRPGMTKSTYGTGCFIIANTGKQQLVSQQQLLTTVGYRIQGETTYALEGSIFVAGASIKWLRDNLGLIDDASESGVAAVRCGGDAAGVYFVPAFTGLGAPHWAPQARGLISGLTFDTSRDQIVTAALQSVAFQTAELVGAMGEDGAGVERLRVDGGMVINDWLCQFLSDMLELPVQRPVITETTALGAAMLAGLGGGLVTSLEDAAALWTLEREFLPSMPAKRRAELLSGWRRAVAMALL